ncbi:hypothetical protein VTL71DRAFT_15320, partial [Oculimacula yallundae]
MVPSKSLVSRDFVFPLEPRPPIGNLLDLQAAIYSSWDSKAFFHSCSRRCARPQHRSYPVTPPPSYCLVRSQILVIIFARESGTEKAGTQLPFVIPTRSEYPARKSLLGTGSGGAITRVQPSPAHPIPSELNRTEQNRAQLSRAELNRPIELPHRGQALCKNSKLL